MSAHHSALTVPLLLALACSPTEAPPLPEGGALGGASFVIWPPAPSVGEESPADNPWLTGAALGSSSGSSAAGGAGADPLPAAASGAAGPSEQGSGGGLAAPAGGSGGSQSPVPGPARLLFRAYVESSGSFKGLLIEHVAGGPSGSCAVELYSNGNTEVWRSLAVPSGLESGERALLCVPDGALPACSIGFGGSVYNGNDALVLRCDGEALDTLGSVGADPGKGWTGPGYDGLPISTVDGGLWRCAGGGDPSAVAFDSLQWMSWDWAADASWQGPVCATPDAGLAGSGGL